MTLPLVALGAAVLGLVLQRRRSGAVVVLTLLAVLALVAGSFAPVETEFVERSPRTGNAALVEATTGTELAATAALAGPRARDLTFVLERPGGAMPSGPLGASARLGAAPLPFAPEDISVRLLRRPEVGRPVAVTASVPWTGSPFAAHLCVRHGDDTVCERPIELGAAPASIEFTPDRIGPHDIELEVDLPGRPTKVSARGRFVVEPAPRALVLEQGDVLAAALEAQGIVVDRGWDGEGLQGPAVVVVSSAQSVDRQTALVAALDDGLGLFLLAPAFGAPGEPLHGQLPVRPEPVPSGPGPGSGPGPAQPGPVPPEPKPPEREPPVEPPGGKVDDPSPISPEPMEVDKRSIAMVLLIDRSISMGDKLPDGGTAMSYAKTSALQTARALTEGDRVGIVTFGQKSAGRVELPMTDAMDRAVVRRALETLRHGDPTTHLLAGLRKAGRLIVDEEAAVKQIVVISDGEFVATEEPALRREARQLFEQSGVATSIVSIGRLGPVFSRLADSITHDGGGRFWAADVAQGVPAIVSVEVTRALERAGREPQGTTPDGSDPPPEQPGPEPETEPEPPEPERDPPEPKTEPEPELAVEVVVRAVARSPVLAPAPAADWPTLLRAVPTSAPLDAQVLLVAGDEGWPLLAFANRGLGRIGAFCADLAGEDGRAWRDEQAFPARLALWVQHVMRFPRAWAATGIELSFEIEPRIATPAEVAALESLAGGALDPVAGPLQPTPPQATPQQATWGRQVRSLIPFFALAALAALVLLALAERIAATRGVT